MERSAGGWGTICVQGVSRLSKDIYAFMLMGRLCIIKMPAWFLLSRSLHSSNTYN